jgi:RHS repeat-associated protein
MKKSVILLVLLMISFSLASAKVVDIPEVKQGELTPEGGLPESLVQEGITRYVYAGSNLVASQDNDGIKYYHQDRLSNRIVTDSLGNKDSEYLSLPFGKSVIDEIKYGFTGKEKDESGLHYFGARYYDSNLGRFFSRDPVASEPAYQYVGNNPMNFVDPTGMNELTLMELTALERRGDAMFRNFDVARREAFDLAFGSSSDYFVTGWDPATGTAVEFSSPDGRRVVDYDLPHSPNKGGVYSAAELRANHDKAHVGYRNMDLDEKQVGNLAHPPSNTGRVDRRLSTRFGEIADGDVINYINVREAGISSRLKYFKILRRVGAEVLGVAGDAHGMARGANNPAGAINEFNDAVRGSSWVYRLGRTIMDVPDLLGAQFEVFRQTGTFAEPGQDVEYIPSGYYADPLSGQIRPGA